MVRLDDEAATRVMTWGGTGPDSVSLRHALIHRAPGLWGDHPRRPTSVVLVREVDESRGWHVFGIGAAEPAVGWLARQGRAFELLAPGGWEGAIRRRSGRVVRDLVETWVREPGHPPALASSMVPTRPLTHADERAFVATAPGWALRAWGSFARLIDAGAAFGVPARDGGLAAVAWVFEGDHDRDSIGVATRDRYRRLGLGRAAASALADHVESARRKAPIWTVSEGNVPSKALARSLGFSPRAREVVLSWSPRHERPEADS